jgi:hypothetical protein
MQKKKKKKKYKRMLACAKVISRQGPKKFWNELVCGTE